MPARAAKTIDPTKPLQPKSGEPSSPAKAPTLSAQTRLDWHTLDALKYRDEAAAAADLLAQIPLDPPARAGVEAQAQQIVRAARGLKRRKGVMESFLEEFGLTNSEGLALMCLAEALLRVPDPETADKLIAEKIKSGKWEDHAGQSDHWLVNAGVWGLMLTGRVVSISPELKNNVSGFVERLVQRAGEPVIRAAMMQAMRILGEQFVLGRTIEAALKRGEGMVRAGQASAFSFDMLGEGARTRADAARYFESYANAIQAVSAHANGLGPQRANGVSVKLSALHPRFEARLAERVHGELYPRVVELAQLAKAGDIGFCLDAEEADRLVITLEILDRLSGEPSLAGWDGLGLALQAYSKRAPQVVEKVIELARLRQRRLMTRLVKGAYWDGEIKRAQQAGRQDFPVWTTKHATDVCYLVCAAKMLANADVIYPQFATHNAHTAMAVARMAEAHAVRNYEFQRLHGMGEALYEAGQFAAPVRIYAPVGGHEDLLPYLVRRLLENGANTSFVNSFLDDDVAPERVAADPITRFEAGPKRHPRLPPPPLLYGPSRRNSAGRDLSIRAEREALAAAAAKIELSLDPHEASPDQVEAAIAKVFAFRHQWNAKGGAARARILRAMGDALEKEMDPLIALIAKEAGRNFQDGIDEVREAVDFCRYYAAEAERLFAQPQRLPGPAGETNHLELHGRGVFACISPWNFPLAIFTGQLAAALAAGNTVIAKPAEQTPRIAAEAVRLFRAAGLPEEALQLACGRGETVGAAIVADPRIAGIAFTGGTDTAKLINKTLAERPGPIPTFIAETGGLNAMFVDTTALKEQVVDDAILSAFGSAGQRCSALRILLLPNETADSVIETLIGAMAELSVAPAHDPRTDIGPVIDAEAKANLEKHLMRMKDEAKILAQANIPSEERYFPPTLVEINRLDQIDREIFGPILHVLRYAPADLPRLGAQLAEKGYGLTLGIHSRLEGFAAAIQAAVPAGNCYINRSMIGAVVGVQPFGGIGLSGTGPKAGGPFYLPRFAHERTITNNIAAQGGDPQLLNL